MKTSKNLSPSHHSTLYTKEEITETGCCFTLFQQKNTNNNKNILPFRNHSEPKTQKIQLVIAKRGQTLGKENIKAIKQSLKVKSTPYEIKPFQANPRSNQTSNVTTQKNSLRTSMIKHGNQANASKAITAGNYQQCIGIKKEHIKPAQVTINQTRADSSNIQFLSEISLVEEEFISYESTTLRALNILANDRQYLPFQAMEDAVTPVKFMIDCLPDRKPRQIQETANPLQKLLQRKKGLKEPTKKKLVL